MCTKLRQTKWFVDACNHIAELLGWCWIYSYSWMVEDEVTWNCLRCIKLHFAQTLDQFSREEHSIMHGPKHVNLETKPRTCTVHPSVRLGHMCQNNPNNVCFLGKICQTCSFVVFTSFTSLLAIVGFTPAIVDDSAAGFCYEHSDSHFWYCIMRGSIW